MPDFGLGHWPHREPPSFWSEEEFKDAKPGQLRPMMHKMIRIEAGEAAALSAWEQMLGSGVLVRIAAASTSAWLSNSMTACLEVIPHRAFHSFPFYVSLLEGKALAGYSAQELSHWMCEAECYLRESQEDEGLLIVWSGSADSLFEQLAEDEKLSSYRWCLDRSLVDSVTAPGSGSASRTD